MADDTLSSIHVTLWSRHLQIEDAKFEGSPIVVLKGVTLSEWNGRLSGSLGDSGILQFSPQLREAKKVQRWWAQGGSGAAIAPLVCGTRFHMSIKTLREVACHEFGDRAEVFTTYAWLRMVRLCKRGESQHPVRLTIRCKFTDFSDGFWVTTFHEAAREVLGMSAEAVREVAGDDLQTTKLEAVLGERYFNRLFELTLRGRRETYRGNVRTNIVCVDARRVSSAEYCRNLLLGVRKMLAG